MQEDPKEREIANKILKATEEAYGFIPLVNQVLSERPDLFITTVNFSRSVLEGNGDLDKKTRYLAAISAASALGGEHCIRVQIEHALSAGATKDEILESMLIGSMMAMTHSQSYSLRVYAEKFLNDKE
jgi:alkylhydroperoxidase/carboxymuconolactone decarboxylase family protein YurZ